MGVTDWISLAMCQSLLGWVIKILWVFPMLCTLDNCIIKNVPSVCSTFYQLLTQEFWVSLSVSISGSCSGSGTIAPVLVLSAWCTAMPLNKDSDFSFSLPSICINSGAGPCSWPSVDCKVKCFCCSDFSVPHEKPSCSRAHCHSSDKRGQGQGHQGAVEHSECPGLTLGSSPTSPKPVEGHHSSPLSGIYSCKCQHKE